VLFNLIRGTGLAGLAGISKFRPLSNGAALVRPMLDVTREAVLAYLREIGQPYREDATNQFRTFTRNRIRHDLLPMLEEQFNPNVRSALCRLSQLAGEANQLLSEQAAEIASRAARPIAGAGGYEIDAAVLTGVPPLLARYTLIHLWQQAGWPQQDMGFEEWSDLLSIVRPPAIDSLQGASSASRSRHFPGGILAEPKAGTVRLLRDATIGKEIKGNG
jgi:tRNA(Ile)-lysidine synthase